MLIHITHNASILCHGYEAGLMLTVDFIEAAGMNRKLLCGDCRRRYRNITRMIGAAPPLSKEIRIGTAEKRLIVAQMEAERISNI